MSDAAPSDHESPVESLGVLAKQHVEVAPGLEHHELYTIGGLLSLLWHKVVNSTEPNGAGVVMGGGAMGGLLGGGGLYHHLGRQLAELSIPSVSVGWRQPNNLDVCTNDMLAAMQLMAAEGATRFVTIGHSFGGAIAIRAAASVPQSLVPGIVTLATQSGGCEPAESLRDRELLLFHGDNDQILPHMTSEMVQMIAGTGELVILPGADHLLATELETISDRLIQWIPDLLL
jgi:fermentation-respiration switch protein FrsA (DUF1100 family)